MLSIPLTVDEMISVVSQADFCSISWETSPPPPLSSLLFAAVEDATLAEGLVNSAGCVVVGDGDGDAT